MNAKSYADHKSLFSVIHDNQASANVLDKDLEMIHNWDFKWKMNFNPDSTKQAHEVIFSRITKKTTSSFFSVKCYSINISKAPRNHTRLYVNI